MAVSGQMSVLVVVDGHNLFNDVGRFLTDDNPTTEQDLDIRRRYYTEWFDIDRLVEATIRQDLEQWRDLGIVIFRSKKALGTGDYHVVQEGARGFWTRQGSNPNSSTQIVEIEGGKAGKDTGLDTAMVVYLYETLNRWDSVVLFTNDADFVPAVWSLRRMGKRVFCASHTRDRVTPLVESCQDFYAWDTEFLTADRTFWEILQPGGAIDAFLTYPEAAERNPRVRVEEACVCVAPTRNQFEPGQQNHLNDLIRRHHLVSMIDHGALKIFPLPTLKAVRPPPNAKRVIAGIRRHRNLFTASAWHKILEQ